jgi:transglutaminase-like putative cysteine protease
LAVCSNVQDDVQKTIFPKIAIHRTSDAVLAEIDMNEPIGEVNAGKGGTVLLPVPSDYEGQKVVSFKMFSPQEGAIKSWKWIMRPDGLNRVCQAEVAPSGKGAMICYQAIVLLPPKPESTPDHAKPDAWLTPTACVQATDPDLKALASKLAKEAKGREDLVQKTVDWVALNNGKAGQAFTALDAKAGYLCGGSCTDRANLCAALLRANGIPARTVSHMPTWAEGKFYQHWLTEYWKSGQGWVMVEPTLGILRPDRNTVVELAISSPQDEQKAFDPVHLRMSMPGSAYLSLTEVSPELTSADIVDDDALNWIKTLNKVPSSSKVWEAASKRAKVVAASCEGGNNAVLDPETLKNAKGADALAAAFASKQK